MSTVEDCIRTGDQLVGATIRSVKYVAMNHAHHAESQWDFGEWHWPEVGIELETTDGDLFHFIWDSKVTQYELTFGKGPMAEQWLPLGDDPSIAWDVSEHPLWRPLLAAPVTKVGFGLFLPEAPVLVKAPPGVHIEFVKPVKAPVGARIEVAGKAAWAIAAQPKHFDRPPKLLGEGDVYLGSDEVIVAFGDALAARLGLSDKAGC